MKPRSVIVSLLIFALAAPVQMLAQQNSKAEKEVRAVLAESEQGNLKGGAEAVAIFEKIVADEWIRIAPNGAVFTKAELLDNFRAGKWKLESLENSDVKIRIYGQTAVVTGIATETRLRFGASVAERTRWTRVLEKRGGVWQVVLFQSTNIAEPSSAQASNNAPPSYVANPANYKVIGENDLFRVILEKKPVGVRDPWHSHLDSAVYLLTDCHQRTYMPDGTTRETTREKGSVVWQAAMTHSTENLGTSECVMLLVERK
jgi:hypothetical protein